MATQTRNLVEAAQRGNIEAENELARRIEPRAEEYARVFTKNSPSAPDHVQNANLKAFSNLKSLSNPREFFAWWKEIFRNTFFSSRRKKRLGSDEQERIEQVPAAGTSPSERVYRQEERDSLRAQVASLSHDERTAIELRWLQEMSEEEVAAAMNRTPDSARSLLYRAKKKLSTQLKHELDTD